MPRIRTVKPEFWEDDTIGGLSFGARLLFIATWNLADDEGLLRWTPAYIKAQVFMYDDDIDIDAVELFMDELVKAEVLFPYRGGKSQQRLSYIVNFHKHQRINRPSPAKLPAPSLQNPQVLIMYAERDGWTCHICGGEVERFERHWSKQASIDHIHPRAKGGTDYPSNLGLAHVACNSGKRDTVPMEPVMEPSVSDSVSDSAPEGKGREGKGRERLEGEYEGESAADLKTIQLAVAYEHADRRIADGYQAKSRDALAHHLRKTDAAVAAEARRRFVEQTPIAGNVRELVDRIGRPIDEAREA